MSKESKRKADVLFKNDGLDQFLNTTIVNRRGAKVNVIISDIGFLLMNKDTLSRMDSGLLSILNDRFSGISESASSALDSFSDDDKISVLKSRYLQSPSEIENFSKFINDNFDSLVSDMKAAQDSSAQDSSAQKSSDDPSPALDSTDATV